MTKNANETAAQLVSRKATELSDDVLEGPSGGKPQSNLTKKLSDTANSIAANFK